MTGIICLEIGSEQKNDVTKIFESRNFKKIDEKKIYLIKIEF